MELMKTIMKTPALKAPSTAAAYFFQNGAAGVVVLLTFLLIAIPVAAVATDSGAPLIIGNRTVHVFRVPLGAISAAERAEGARHRIEKAFGEPGEGWTSVLSTPQGVMVQIDGKPLFLVLEGDVSAPEMETLAELANKASRVLQKTWSEARERHDSRAIINASLKVLAATVLLAVFLAIIAKLSKSAKSASVPLIERHLRIIAEAQPGSHMLELLPGLVSWLIVVAAWIMGLFAVFSHTTYSLKQFAFTRPIGERFLLSFKDIVFGAFSAVVSSLPGLFVAVIIFFLAWTAMFILRELFFHIEANSSESSVLNVHTAPATRRIVNVLLWLFAIAMAYPYIPGSQTEAFKALSVIVGLMVSLGATGIVGQVASGMMLVYTRAFKRGEYVRINDYEGTVTELGLFVTRLRTGLGQEIALPNAFVLANVTRNFSRAAKGNAFILDVTVTIGYDAPWRQVHAMLLEATENVPHILKDPAPFVVQTALSDFYVEYKLVTNVGSEQPGVRARTISNLHAAIQDAFNRHGVQIMSPHYAFDPKAPKVVPESEWSGPVQK